MRSKENITKIESFRKVISNVVGNVLPCDSSCALVDFPNYANVGDSAILLGEVEFLYERDMHIRYVCDPGNYVWAELVKAIGNAPILITGGGNLGDLWEKSQLFREKIILHFPDNPIVQFPQSIFFENNENFERAKRIFDTHNNLTLLLRDQVSLNFARTNFNCRSELCPDMAFYIKPERFAQKQVLGDDIIYLSRTDKESTVHKEIYPRFPRIKTVDWVTEKKPVRCMVYHGTSRLSRIGMGGLPWVQKIRLNAANAIALERLNRGVKNINFGSTDSNRSVTRSHFVGVVESAPFSDRQQDREDFRVSKDLDKKYSRCAVVYFGEGGPDTGDGSRAPYTFLN